MNHTFGKRVGLSQLSFLFIGFFLLLGVTSAKACDTTPTITTSNVTSIGGGFFTLDVQVCMGSGGSIDGYDLTMGCGLAITATAQATQNNGGRIAVASITGGVLNYFYPGPGNFEPNDGISGPCFTQTITVNGDPTGCTVTTTGVNDGCLIISTSWSTTVPGPCIVDHTLTGAGAVPGSTTTGGNNCSLRPSQDQVIQVTIPCNDTWTFSLCGGSTWDTYLYLGTGCCTSNIAANDDNCGLQSSITSVLTAGTYFVTVEGYGSGSAGTYTLNVSSGAPCIFLPISLTSFSGDYQAASRTNELFWTTSSETNNDFFLVERSFDGITFSPIADIDGAGNTSSKTDYVYHDPIESSGVFYYRLKQVDFNGSFSYSNTISLNAKMDDSAFFGSVFPNPAKESFTLTTAARTQANPIVLSFYTNQGQLVKTVELAGSSNPSNYDIDTESMKSGVYVVRLESGDQKTETRKIVIL